VRPRLVCAQGDYCLVTEGGSSSSMRATARPTSATSTGDVHGYAFVLLHHAVSARCQCADGNGGFTVTCMFP